jgi:DNA gyrase inhibitor GyrI
LKKLKYIEENVAAINIKLTSEEVQVLRQAAEVANIPGGQYAGAFLDVHFANSPALE